jgi:hypothetical protein
MKQHSENAEAIPDGKEIKCKRIRNDIYQAWNSVHGVDDG